MYVFLVLKKSLNGSVGLMDRSWGFMVSFGPGTKESQGGEFKILTGEVPVNLLNRSKGSFATTLETLAEKNCSRDTQVLSSPTCGNLRS